MDTLSLSPPPPLSLLSLSSLSLLSHYMYASLTYAPLSGLRKCRRTGEILPDGKDAPGKSSVPPRERLSSVTSSEFFGTPSGASVRVELRSCIVEEEEDLICISAQDAFPCEEERLDTLAGDALPAAALLGRKGRYSTRTKRQEHRVNVQHTLSR